MKSWSVHYLNKYPGGHVEASDSSFKVYNVDGKLVVALNFGGDGQWHDQSESMGLQGRHDLSPIPKNSRVFKIVDGKVVRDELADEREAQLSDFQDEDGKVMSCHELKELGYTFDDKHRVENAPALEEHIDESTGEVTKKKKKVAAKKKSK